jgi:hypothetical protein
MRIPVPHYNGFSLFKSWLGLSVMEKLRSLVGTLKRIIVRRWTKPLKPVIGGERLQDTEGKEKPLMNVNEVESRCKV